MNSLIGFGFFSAFIIGPSTARLIASTIHQRKLPWGGLSALLTADVLFLATAVYLVKSSKNLPSELTKSLTAISAILFLCYGSKLIFGGIAKEVHDSAKKLSTSFKRIFRISITNVNLVAIYTGLLIQAKIQSQISPDLAAFTYISAFALGCFCLLNLSNYYRSQIQNFIRPIEISTGVLFIGFSLNSISRIV